METKKELAEAVSKAMLEGAERAASEQPGNTTWVLKKSTDGGFVALIREVAALKDQLAELHAQPFRYLGPHETGKAYQRGTFVSHGGGLWHANQTTTARPGDGPAWTLAVKAGRDGRDAR